MKEWLKKLFSEAGEASYSRFASFVALISTVAWVSYVIYHTKRIPELTGPIAFPATLYGLGKGAETMRGIGANARSQEPRGEESK